MSRPRLRPSSAWQSGICAATALALVAAAVLPARGQAPSPAAPPSAAPGSPGTPAARESGRSEALRQRRAAKGNLLGHGGPIKAIAADPASGRVLTGSFDYSMMLWDVAGDVPREMARLARHDGAVNAVAFVPGGTLALAAGDDGKVTLWDLETGHDVQRFEGHAGKIVHLSVSPDGRRAVSSGWDRTARIWDLAQRQPGPVLSGHAGPVNAAVFSADGARVYTASADGTIGVWRASDGRFDRPLLQNGFGVNVLARLPDGALAYGTVNGAAGVLDPVSGRVVKELQPHERPVLALAVTAKPGLLATGGGDGRIRVYRLPDGALIEEHRNLLGPVWALSFNADGTGLWYGSLDDFALFWQVAPRAAFEPVANAGPRRFQMRDGGQDVLSQGEVQFARKCSICHTLDKDGANRAGPTLYGVFGRKIGTLAGYPYSDALRGMDIVWTEDSIDKLFALGPDTFTPGSKMPLQRMTDAAQRAALIAYLKAATAPANGNPAVDAGPGSVQDSKPNPELKR